MYAGKTFWEEPPHSGLLSDYGEHMHMWNPWYWSMRVRERPWRHYENAPILHRKSNGDSVGHRCLALGRCRHPTSDKSPRIGGLLMSITSVTMERYAKPG
jgi:hypothetical protein